MIENEIFVKIIQINGRALRSVNTALTNNIAWIKLIHIIQFQF